MIALGVVLLIAAGVVAGIAISTGSGGTSGAAAKTNRDVTLEAVSTPVRNPYMPSVGTDLAGVTSPTTPTAGAIQSYPGGTTGLYGGTRDNASCDRDRLVAYLEQTPDKAAAWAATLGIQPSQIRSYVATLTTVVLRSDTRVTNHGYLNGRATVIPAVLQAGTAVLVNQYGEPVVKCFCGNPLTPPTAFANPVYSGTPWPTFQPTNIVVIVKNTVIINTFTVVDVRTGQPFGRSGTTDGPPPASTTTSTTGITTSTTQPPATTTSSTAGIDVNGTYAVTASATCGSGNLTGTLTARVNGTMIDITAADGTRGTGSYNPTDLSFSASGQGATAAGRFDGSGGVSGTITGNGCTVTFTGHKTG